MKWSKLFVLCLAGLLVLSGCTQTQSAPAVTEKTFEQGFSELREIMGQSSEALAVSLITPSLELPEYNKSTSILLDTEIAEKLRAFKLQTADSPLLPLADLYLKEIAVAQAGEKVRTDFELLNLALAEENYATLCTADFSAQRIQDYLTGAIGLEKMKNTFVQNYASEAGTANIQVSALSESDLADLETATEEVLTTAQEACQ